MKKYIAAHKNSTHHRKEIESSTVCGCFHCLNTFSPFVIYEWVDKETTALCPKCGIDAVIGNSSGFPITEEFLKQMKDFWFS